MLEARQYKYQEELIVKKNEPQKNITKREKRKKILRPDAKFYVKSVLTIFILALLLVYVCIKSATLGYEIVQLEKEIHTLETENQRLVYDIAEKSSLERIELIAIEELGMHKPSLNSNVTIAALPEKVSLSEGYSEIEGSGVNIGEKIVDKIFQAFLQLADNSQ